MKVVLMFYTFTKTNKWRKISLMQSQRIYLNTHPAIKFGIVVGLFSVKPECSDADMQDCQRQFLGGFIVTQV